MKNNFQKGFDELDESFLNEMLVSTFIIHCFPKPDFHQKSIWSIVQYVFILAGETFLTHKVKNEKGK